MDFKHYQQVSLKDPKSWIRHIRSLFPSQFNFGKHVFTDVFSWFVEYGQWKGEIVCPIDLSSQTSSPHKHKASSTLVYGNVPYIGYSVNRLYHHNVSLYAKHEYCIEMEKENLEVMVAWFNESRINNVPSSHGSGSSFHPQQMQQKEEASTIVGFTTLHACLFHELQCSNLGVRVANCPPQAQDLVMEKQTIAQDYMPKDLN